MRSYALISNDNMLTVEGSAIYSVAVPVRQHVSVFYFLFFGLLFYALATPV